MNRYIKYVRISQFFSNESLEEKLNSLITDDLEIIYYNESIRDKDSIHVTMVCGKLNLANKKQIL
ncbi:MAG: hypothetical protein ACOC33_03560 [bacterium]